MQVTVGNTAKRVSEVSVEWKFYIRTDDADAIEQVKVHLHPTFNPPVITINAAPFEVKRSGWGTFPIKAEVKFKGVSDIWTVQHDLQFTAADQAKSYQINVPKAQVPKKQKETVKRIDFENVLDIHGHHGDESWEAPRLVAESNQACRKDQNNNILANEYLDEPDVLRAKMKKIAELIRKSKCCVAYTGAGLSRASGIPDYASKAKNSVVNNAPKLASSLDALPTYAHRVITAMERKGYIHHYVQQNHDGLPQKSGFPQSKMNEIHGAWFDPSNPVVQFSGSLRSDLFQWMTEMEQKADLCLCLGTSLSGMNADRMAKTPAKKMFKKQALGTIIINLQKTPLDSKCAIRVWAKLDDAFKLLIEELEISEQDVKQLPSTGNDLPEKYKDKFPVPYDHNGAYSPSHTMILDLTSGAKVRIAAPGASNENALGEICGKRNGDYSVLLHEKEEGSVRRLFGKWWVEEALQGTIPQLPLVNQKPQFLTNKR